MRRYRLAPLAKADLEEIWLYVAQRASVEAADRLIDSIAERFVLLAGTPEAGRSRDDLDVGVRSFPVGEYLIYYRKAKQGGLVVSRVLHGKRDQEKAYGPEESG